MISGWSNPQINALRNGYHVTPISQLARVIRKPQFEVMEAAEKLGLKNGVNIGVMPEPKQFLQNPQSEIIRQKLAKPNAIKPRRNASPLTAEQKSQIVELYWLHTNNEIAEITGCSFHAIARFANVRKLSKSEETRGRSVSQGRAKVFAKAIANENVTTTKAFLIRKLSEASRLIKSRDHVGALEVIESAVMYVRNAAQI